MKVDTHVQYVARLLCFEIVANWQFNLEREGLITLVIKKLIYQSK